MKSFVMPLLVFLVLGGLLCAGIVVLAAAKGMALFLVSLLVYCGLFAWYGCLNQH
jgi:hypothetical protein